MNPPNLKAFSSVEYIALLCYKENMDNDNNNKMTAENMISAEDKDTVSKSSYTRGQRLLARIALVLIALLLVLLFVLLAVGASPGAILSVLFFLIVVPCVLYGFRLYKDFTRRK